MLYRIKEIEYHINYILTISAKLRKTNIVKSQYNYIYARELWKLVQKFKKYTINSNILNKNILFDKTCINQYNIWNINKHILTPSQMLTKNIKRYINKIVYKINYLRENKPANNSFRFSQIKEGLIFI